VSILIAGIGNIFLGDDAFGVELAQRLARRALPRGVEVVDFGIRGFDLVHALLEEHEATLLLDATPRGGAPGTLYLIEPAPDELAAADGEGAASIDPHGMEPLRVLRLAWAMGARPKRLLVVGCEPSLLDPEDEAAGRLGLSQPVQAAIDEAVTLVESVLERLLAGGEDAMDPTGWVVA